jgi:predicted metal-dependent HD superfamily phosphohydrolase
MTHSPESLPAPENTKLGILRENFCGIFDESKRTEAEELFKKIAEEYQAETREYHNFEHISDLSNPL